MKKVCLCVCVCGGGKLFFSGNSFEKFAMLSPYSAVHYIYTARFIFTLKIFGVEVKSYYAPPTFECGGMSPLVPFTGNLRITSLSGYRVSQCLLSQYLYYIVCTI